MINGFVRPELTNMLAPIVVNYTTTGKLLTGIYFISMTFVLIFLDVYLVSMFKEKMVKSLKYIQVFFGLAMVGFGVLMLFKALV